jgi:hypothetical protein
MRSQGVWCKITPKSAHSVNAAIVTTSQRRAYSMKIPLIFLALAVGMISSPSCNAHDDDLSSKVVEWVKEGKVLPFDTIMQRYESRLKGRLLDLEVEQKHGRIIYELEILRDDGIVYEIKIDAKTGEWLKEKVD